jgi:hypothetical protein
MHQESFIRIASSGTELKNRTAMARAYRFHSRAGCDDRRFRSPAFRRTLASEIRCEIKRYRYGQRR